MSDAPATFDTALAAARIELEPGERDRLAAYLDRLLETNRQFNLTAIKDPEHAWMRHIYDALTLLPLLASVDAQRVADVGSGGGLPGIPLAITMPDVPFTLIEATGKKAGFLERVATELELGNVTVHHGRSEDLARDVAHQRRYDVVTARAVGRLPVLLPMTVPLLKAGGLLLAIKGEQAPVEVEEAADELRRCRCAVIDQRRTETGTIVVIERQTRATRGR